jgi:hypothetical protein
MNKSTLLSLFIVFAFFSCKKVNYELTEKPAVGIGINNAFVLESRYVSHTADKLYIEMDIGVVYSGEAIDNIYLPDSTFKNTQFSTHQTIIESVERIQKEDNVAYSNLIAIDMSADWNDITDLMNLRTRALNKTILETLENPNNEMAFGTFRRDEFGNNQTFTHIRSIGSAYQQSQENLGAILFDLYYEEMGGTSNLYDAMDSFLEYANNRSTHPNKNLTFICRGYPDNLGTNTVSQVIAKAQTYGVKINMIIIGNDFNWSMVSIACRTGGFINIISSTDDYDLTNGGLMDKGTPMMASLNRPLSKNIHIYRVKMKLLKNSGVWTSGSFVYDYYQSNLKFEDGSNRLNNYLPYYVNIP